MSQQIDDSLNLSRNLYNNNFQIAVLISVSWRTHNIHRAKRLDDANVQALRQSADCIIVFRSYHVPPLIPDVLSIPDIENHTVSIFRRFFGSRLTVQGGKLYTFNLEGKDFEIYLIYSYTYFLFFYRHRKSRAESSEIQKYVN